MAARLAGGDRRSAGSGAIASTVVGVTPTDPDTLVYTRVATMRQLSDSIV